MIENIEIKVVKKVPVEEFKALYMDAGWWKSEYDSDTRFIAKLAKGSECFVAAFYDGKMIGMGRAISDGCSDAYIQDVVVLSEFRKRGIARAIINKIVSELESRGVDWIGLVAQPGTEKFYEALSFEKMEDHVPMLLNK